MGLLENARIYLSGPIESSKDATSWRDRISKDLKPIKVKIWDPLVKPSWMNASVDGAKQQQYKKQLCDNTCSSEIIDNNHSVRKMGLHLAANCDILIVKVGEQTVGTWEELQVARFKPIFVICEDIDIPSMWLVDQLDAYHNINFVFHRTIHSLVYLLNRIDGGKVNFKDPYKWSFLTYGDRNA